jgi:hypothetical protein
MKRYAMVILGLVSLLSACGNSGFSGTASCEGVLQGVHVCEEFMWSGAGSDPTSGIAQACTGKGGTPVASCPSTGSIGGCQMMGVQNGINATVTIFLYSGTASAAMSACQKDGGTWITM